MGKALDVLDTIDGISTVFADAFLAAFLIMAALLVFFAGVAVSIGVTVWDGYEYQIRSAVARAKTFFSEHILGVASMF